MKALIVDDEPDIREELAEFVGQLGLGVVVAGVCFENVLPTPVADRFTLFSGGLIPLCNIAIGLMVAGALFVAFCALAASQRVVERSASDAEGT